MDSSWPMPVRSRRSSSRRCSGSKSSTRVEHVDAPHPNCAYAWLEHSLDGKVQGDLAAWFGSLPAVPGACQGNALLGEKGCETNGFGEFDRIAFWKTPKADCGDGRTDCVPYLSLIHISEPTRPY